MKGARVIPLLFNLEFSDITGPLAQFQAKKFAREGLGEVIQSINQASDGGVPNERATQLFEALWPKLEALIEAVPDQAPTEKHMRPQHEIIEELVAGVRGLDSRLGDVAGIVSEQSHMSPRHRMRRFPPRMFDEIAHMISGEPGDPIVFLVWAGFVRDELPWLAEVMVETYREVKSGDPAIRRKSIERLRRLLRSMDRGPMMEMVGAHSKYMHRLLHELPMRLDHALHRFEIRELPFTDESEDETKDGE